MHAREAESLVRQQRHPPPVERILLAIAAQWPALVTSGSTHIGEAWIRTAGEWTPDRTERALDAVARMERPPTPGQLLAATRPARGPSRSTPAAESEHPALRAERERQA